MSASAPDFVSSVAAVYRIAWTRLVRGRKLLLGAGATLLIVTASVATRYLATETSAEDVVEGGVSVGFFGMLAYLLPFLCASGAISEEVESRTFPYLAMRPTGRVALTLGKWLAAASMSALVLGVGVIVLHVAAWATEPSDMIDEMPGTLRIVGALVLLSFCYSAICLFWGALVVEAAGVMAALHLAFLEFAISVLPGAFRFGSMNYLASQLAGLPKGGFRPDWVPDIEVWICGVVVSVVMLVFLGLAAVVVESSEFGYGRA